MALISVIIPVHNCELYIERCVKSVQNQDYKDLEIILVVNNSQDKSLKYCERLAESDSRIIVINTGRGGVSFARNLGLKKSKGEYITFIDSDDYIDSTMISNLLNNLYKTTSDISICSFKKINDERVVDSQDFYEASLVSLNNNQAIQYFLEDKIKGYVWGKLFRKNLLSNLKFNEEFIMCEDELFLLEALQKTSNVCISNQEYYFYVQHKTSVCNSIFKEDVRWDCVKSKKIIFDTIKQNYRQYIKEAHHKYTCELIRYSILASTADKNISRNRKQYISRNLRKQILYIFNMQMNIQWKIYGILLMLHYSIFNIIFKINKKCR